ncbi:MAG TPA: hypothetical protein VIJ92_11920 [Ginsengibacter sp.]
MSITKSIPLPGSHFIPLQKAVEMATLFRQQNENILATEYRKQNILAHSETFNRHAFEKLLAETDCAGIRIYYGMDEKLKVHAVLVGVNDSNEDILPSQGNQPQSTIPVIVEEGQRCPDICPEKSPLNP